MSTITVPQACCHPGHVSSASLITLIPACLHHFAFSRVSWSWNHTARHLSSLPSFACPNSQFFCLLWLTAHFPSLPTDTPLSGAVACPLITCRTCCLHLALGSSEHSFWMHPYGLVLFFQTHGNPCLDITAVTRALVASMLHVLTAEGFPCSFTRA